MGQDASPRAHGEGGKEESSLNEITGGMGDSAKAFVTRTRQDRAAFRNRTRATARRADERKEHSQRSEIKNYLNGQG